jgi:hypothetical protein
VKIFLTPSVLRLPRYINTDNILSSNVFPRLVRYINTRNFGRNLLYEYFFQSTILLRTEGVHHYTSYIIFLYMSALRGSSNRLWHLVCDSTECDVQAYWYLQPCNFENLVYCNRGCSGGRTRSFHAAITVARQRTQNVSQFILSSQTGSPKLP